VLTSVPDLLQAHVPPALPLSALCRRQVRIDQPGPDPNSVADPRRAVEVVQKCRRSVPGPAITRIVAPSTTPGPPPFVGIVGFVVWLNRNPCVVDRSPGSSSPVRYAAASLRVMLPLTSLWSIAVSRQHRLDRIAPPPEGVPEKQASLPSIVR